MLHLSGAFVAMPFWDAKVAPVDLSMSVPDQLEVAGKGFDKAGEITADALAQMKLMAATMDTEKEILKKYAVDTVGAQSDKMKQVASDAMSKSKEMVKVAEEAQGKAIEMYSQMMASGNLATGKANESLQKAEGVDPSAKAMLMSGADTKVMAKYTELLKAGGIEPGNELETIQSIEKLFGSVKTKLVPDGLHLDAKTVEAVSSELPEDTRVKVVAKATEVGTTVESLYSKTVHIVDKALGWIDHTCFPDEDFDAKVAKAKAKDSDDEDDAKGDVAPDIAEVVKGGVSLEAEGSHASGWFGLTQRVTAQGHKAVKVGKRVKQYVKSFNKKMALRKARWGVFTIMSRIALYSFLGFFGLILVAGLGVALLPVLFVIEIMALIAMLTSGVTLCLPA